MSFNSTLRVVITGSRGFIGRHLTQHLRSKVQDLVEWNGDVRGLAKYEKSADVVFHLAGVSRHEQFLNAPHQSYEVNVIGTQVVLNYCRKVGARCILASTSGVYRSSGSREPVSENAPISPILPYGISKWLAECLCKQAEDSGVPSVVLRLFNLYGPGQHKSFLVAHVIDCLMGKQPLVLRMPDAFRDFIYVADVVEVLFKAALLGNAGFKVFNIGGGQAVRVRDMVSIAERIFGPAVSIEHGSSHAGELAASIADISKARRELGWVPQYNLEHGLMAIKASWNK